jgi:hypothetical protein
MGSATGITGTAGPGSTGELDTGTIFTSATVTGDLSEGGGGTGDAVSVDGGVAAGINNICGEGEHEDGGCSIGGDGLGRGNDSSSGGDRDKGESDSDKLLSGSFSLSRSRLQLLFLAFFIGGSAVGKGVRSWDNELVGRGWFGGDDFFFPFIFL